MVKRKLRSGRMVSITKVMGASQGEGRGDLSRIEGMDAAVVKGVFRIVQRRVGAQRVLTTMTKEDSSMRRIVLAVLLVAMFISVAAFAVQAATPEDAKVLADKAVAFWKANGKDKAIAEFNNPKGQFVKGDLYVVVQDFHGGVAAHGGNPGLVGKSLLEQKDPSTGKYFVKEQIEIAKTK